MTSILKLASALCFCFLSLVCNAQTTSGDLINDGQWTGVTYGADPGGCCASISGSAPLYDTTTNTIMYSYGQNTISQTIGINQALGGTGIQVNGYNYSWDYRLVSNNGNANDKLTANITLTNSSGAVVESQDFSYTGAAHDTWFNESGSTTFSNPYTDPQSISLSFSGKDGGFWAGYYGPELKNISLSLNYSAGQDPCIKDPLSSTTCAGYAEAYKSQQCSMNPLYDSSCPGYAEAYFNQQCGYNPLYDAACPGNSAVITSKNLVPNPGSWYREANQSFAINTALSHSGSGLQVHAFRWGFQTFGFSLFGITPGDFKSDVNITDSNGNSIYSFSTDWQNAGIGYNDRSYYYQLPQSRNNLTLGTFEYNTEVSGIASVGNFWATMLYTPDQCSLDPLSSPMCSKYQEAFLEQQCGIYVMFSPQCPGYAEALQKMLDEQAALGTTSDSDPVSSVIIESTSLSSSVSDPIKDETQVTTDVGGAELSTTGEVIVSTGAPEVKEIKETTEEKQTAESTTSATNETTEKKKSSVNALAVAQNAAREAEATALSVTEAAVTASLSESANPGDGINLELGTGLALSGSQTPFGLGSNELQAALVSSDVLGQAARSRQNSLDTASSETVQTENKKLEIVTTEVAIATTESTTEEKSQSGSSVRRGGVVEGMEGGADMDALSKPPAGFNSYLSAQLQDGQFYAPKEIYKNQRNVDNARAFRGLGSDRLHQQMVDQQYNRINN